jgi:dTDP-4-dehydrorhamnose 3,5-epimerase
MIVAPLIVEGAYTLDAEPISDERGYFVRWWDDAALRAAGLADRFAQQSSAWNERAGTLRGLHVALPPAAEAKIVRCVRGAAFDVIVDVRPLSPTFGRHVALRLDDTNPRALYVPPGCAHGYQTLQHGTEMLYDISEAYRPECASGIAYDDPQLAIPWPRAVGSISARDQQLPSLECYVASLAAGALR